MIKSAEGKECVLDEWHNVLIRFFFQTEEQGRVSLCDWSAVLRLAAVRNGAGTRRKHRHFRQRGAKGVSG